MAGYDELYALTQKQMEHIMELSNSTTRLVTQVEAIEKVQSSLSSKMDKVWDKLPGKMTPDMCGYAHAQLETRVVQRVQTNLRKSARGWLNTALVVFKIVTYAAMMFGGATWGASNIGLIP